MNPTRFHPAAALLPADLLILGAGAAGMMTAILAVRHGLSVVVFDPAWSRPNNLAISGGLFPAAGSALQRAAGVADSPDRWLDDLRAFGGDSVNGRIAESVAASLPALTDFLAGAHQVPFVYLKDLVAPGHGNPRFHAILPASGRSLHDRLRAMLTGERLVCVPDAPLTAIERSGSGYAVAARLVDGSEILARAPRLMLAGGGFGGAADLVARYIPPMAGALHSGSATNDGSIIRLAEQWGLLLGPMDGHQGQGHTNLGGRTRLGMSLPTLGAVLVNQSGQRFVAEDIGPSGLAAHVLAQPGQRALEVFDAGIEAQMEHHVAYHDARAAGAILEADGIEALAERAGVPAPALARTLAEVARFAAGPAAGAATQTTADALGRRHFPKVLTAPFRASWVTGSLAHTQGGIATDAAGRALALNGEPVAGLFAAGGCAAGLSGHGGDGYLPGNGLAQSFGLAWAAVAAMR